MRVLVTGAGGFIGQHLTASLLEAGHEVVGAVRDPEALRRRFPEVSAIRVDLNRDTEREVWTPRLQGVEAVVNCAGILQGGRGQSIEAVHHLGPRALFEACVEASVRRVIQVSAISADEAAGTAFASSKKRADDALRSLDLDWVVLRPSLVYARGSYGGTSLMRALAAIPWVLPVPGDGAQPFRPIHVSDLVRTVLWILETPGIRRLILEPVGPEELSLRELLLRFRAWLGLPKARAVSVPLPLIRIATRIGDWLGSGPINSTALTQLEYGNAAPFEPFVQAVGFRPRSFGEALRDEPSEAQDFWHARLYFLGPVLRVALALLWLGSGALGLLYGSQLANQLIEADAIGILPSIAAVTTSILDLLVGAWVLSGRRPVAAGATQIGLIALYTLGLTVLAPALWLDPFGPLLKNLPIAAAILAWMVLERER